MLALRCLAVKPRFTAPYSGSCKSRSPRRKDAELRSYSYMVLIAVFSRGGFWIWFHGFPLAFSGKILHVILAG